MILEYYEHTHTMSITLRHACQLAVLMLTTGPFSLAYLHVFFLYRL